MAGGELAIHYESAKDLSPTFPLYGMWEKSTLLVLWPGVYYQIEKVETGYTK